MRDPNTDPHSRARRGVLAGLAAAVITAMLLTLAVTRGDQRLTSLDHPITYATQGWADPSEWPIALAYATGMLSQPAAAGMLVALLVIWLLRAGLLAVAGLLVISGIAGSVVTRATKILIRRERPPSAEGLVNDMTYSFPSGHSSAGIYLLLATGLVLRHLGRVNGRSGLVRAGVALVIVGPLIGVSRLILGAHWPSDILAGWAFGSTAFLAAALLLWAPLRRGWRLPQTTGPPPSGAAG